MPSVTRSTPETSGLYSGPVAKVEAVGPHHGGRGLNFHVLLGGEFGHDPIAIGARRGPATGADPHPGAVLRSPGVGASTEQSAPRRGVVAHAKAFPERAAIISGSTVRTYGELDGRAQHLAQVLGHMGAGPKGPVAAVLGNGVESFEVATAAAMAGAPFLPVNWHLKAAELEYLLDDAGVRGQWSATSIWWPNWDPRCTLWPTSAPRSWWPRLRRGAERRRRRPRSRQWPRTRTGLLHLRARRGETQGRGARWVVRPKARRAGLEGQAMLWGWSGRGAESM